MTASFALFSHHLFDGAFGSLAGELNRCPGYFAMHIPDGHLLSDSDLATVMQSGVTPPNFAVIGITGPAAELPPLVRLLNVLKMPCAIVLCCEGWKALRKAEFKGVDKIGFTLILEPGLWDDGFDKVFQHFRQTHRVREPRFTPAMAGMLAPYLRQTITRVR